MYYFGSDFLNCCPHHDKLTHKFSVAVSSGLPLVSLVYLGTEMIQSNFKNDFPGLIISMPR